MRIDSQPMPARENDAEQTSISVVVCAYTGDRWDALLRAVESILGQRFPPLETVVVIDHDDLLLARARERFGAEDHIRILENVRGPGLSGARNTGLSSARGEVVAFLDDDAEAESDWLERLAAHYEEPTVLGVGGAIEPAWAAGRPKTFPPELDWIVGCTCSQRHRGQHVIPPRSLRRSGRVRPQHGQNGSPATRLRGDRALSESATPLAGRRNHVRASRASPARCRSCARNLDVLPSPLLRRGIIEGTGGATRGEVGRIAIRARVRDPNRAAGDRPERSELHHPPRPPSARARIQAGGRRRRHDCRLLRGQSQGAMIR
jgi:hypothetical protein